MRIIQTRIRTREDLYYQIFPRISIGVEIGVYEGSNARILQQVVKPASMILVDSWCYQQDWQSPINHSNERFGKIYCSVKRIFCDNPNVHIFCLTSVIAATIFPDGLFDWSYIDSNHNYSCIKLDLNIWWPKVREGGIFAGHDYMNVMPYDEKNEETFEVKRAVDEFAEKKDVDVLITQGGHPSWFIVKKG